MGLVVLSLATVSANAGPEGEFIPWRGGYGEGIVIPRDSPVAFQRFDKQGVAHFSGRFVLTGTFIYGCNIECIAPMKDEELVLAIVPDPALAARLPHWKVRNSDIKIFITHEGPLARAIANRRERAGLRSGKIDELQGHVAVVVDDFVAAIDCDSASYSARFVRISKAPQQSVKLVGDYGCG